MADKNFVVKNGLVVNTDLIVANGDSNRVGINNSSPDASLTVTGTANVSGNVTLGSNLFVSTIVVDTATINSTFASLTSNNANNLGGETPSYYTNATNIITGTLPSGRITGSYTGLTQTGTLGTLTVTGNVTGPNFTVTTNPSSSNVVTIGAANVSVDSGVLFVDAINNRVGLNNTTPDATLTITGTANVSGNVIMTSNLYGNVIVLGTATINSTFANLEANTANNSTRLGGELPAFYRNATNLNDGTISHLRLPAGTDATIGGLRIVDSISNTNQSIAAAANSVKRAYDSAIDANTRAFSAQTMASEAYTNAVSFSTTASATAYTNAITFAANAANITTNTLPTGRLTGSYTGITQVGTQGTLTVTGNSSAVNFSTTSNPSTSANLFTVGAANANFDSGVLFVDAVNNRVGINNTTPDAAVTVTGNANVSGNLIVGGQSSSFGGNVSVTGNLFVSGDLTYVGTSVVQGDFIPDQSGRNLGNTLNRWDLFSIDVASSNTISVGANVSLNVTSILLGNTSEYFVSNSVRLETTANLTLLGRTNVGAGFGSANPGASVNSTIVGVSSNSTVNSSIGPALIQVGNSTSIANLTATELRIGSVLVVNGALINTTTSNATQHTVGSSFTANSAMVNHASLVNTATVNATTVNATSHTAGAIGTGSGGTVSNTTTFFVGNNSSNSVINTIGISVNATSVVNTLGIFTTNFIANSTLVNHTTLINTATVNATSINVGTTTISNSIGFHTTNFVANSTLVNHTSLVNTATVNATTVNATSINVGTTTISNSIGFHTTNFVANSTLVNHTSLVNTATVNATSHTAGAIGTGSGGTVSNTTTFFVGNNSSNSVINSIGVSVNATSVVNTIGIFTTNFIANSTLVNHTSLVNTATVNATTVNAASINVGTTTITNSIGFHTTNFVANSTLVNHATRMNTATMNATTYTVGSSFTASSTLVNHTGRMNTATMNATTVNATTLTATSLLLGTTNTDKRITIQLGDVFDGVRVLSPGTSSGSVSVFEGISYRTDANETFGTRFGAAFRRSNTVSSIVTNQTLGGYYFGGQSGVGAAYASANVLYPAGMVGIAESNFTTNTTMSTAITFRTGSTGQNLYEANFTYGTERMRISANGNIGVGTSSPNNKIHLVDDTNSGWRYDQYNDGDGTNFRNFRSRGTIAVPSAVQAGDRLGSFLAGGRGSTGFSGINGGFNIWAAENFTDSAAGTYLTFGTSATGTNPSGGGTERMRITASGNVGISTSVPQTTLQIGGSVTPGTGEATHRGLVQINSGGEFTSVAGLELKSSAFGSGFGWKIISPDRGSSVSPLSFGYRTNSTTWTEFLTLRNDNGGRVGIGTNNPATKLDVIGEISLGKLSSQDYQGMAIFNLTNSDAVTRYGYVDSRNYNGVADSSIFFTHEPDGRADIVFNVTAAGSKTSDRRSEFGRIIGNKEFAINQGSWIRFPHSSQTDANDGKIGAGLFATGLNIIGVQTSAGNGRKVRIYGELLNDSGNNKYWHQGNDGPDSGLDADLLDGLNSSSASSASTVVTRDSSSRIYGYRGAVDTNANWNTGFSNTPVASKNFHGDISAGGPQGSWWFYESMRHSNALNLWGTQIAWGWEDNANELWQRNVSGGTFSSWVRYWNSGNDGPDSGLNADLLDNLHASSFALLSGATFTGTVTVPSSLIIKRQSGTSEGGEIVLEAPTSTSISGRVIFDVNGNDVRIFEETGFQRGLSIPLTSCSASVGTQVVLNNISQTLTNKRINPRVSSAATGNISPDISSADTYIRTALNGAITISAPTGTPLNGNKLIFRLKDNGTARGLTWTGYRAIGVTLPTSTTAGKVTYVGAIYNSDESTWDVVAVSTQE